MSKFDRVLSGEDLLDVYRSLDNPKRDRDSVIDAMAAAVEAYKVKLAEQEPIAWLIPEGYGSRVTLNENEAKYLKDEWKLDIKPLHILSAFKQGAKQ